MATLAVSEELNFDRREYMSTILRALPPLWGDVWAFAEQQHGPHRVAMHVGAGFAERGGNGRIAGPFLRDGPIA